MNEVLHGEAVCNRILDFMSQKVTSSPMIFFFRLPRIPKETILVSVQISTFLCLIFYKHISRKTMFFLLEDAFSSFTSLTSAWRLQQKINQLVNQNPGFKDCWMYWNQSSALTNSLLIYPWSHHCNVMNVTDILHYQRRTNSKNSTTIVSLIDMKRII